MAGPWEKYQQSAPAASAPPWEKYAQPKAADPSMADDVARSAATGVRQGVEGTIGMFGDTNKMSGDIASWAARKIGLGETGQNVASWIGSHATPTAMFPSTADVRQITTPIVGENYQPQTVAGEYARTVGQFVPGAAIGPGGLMRKAALSVIPAIASETGGQITKGTAAEPYARLGAALLGGFVGGKIAQPAAGKLPTAAEIKASAGYKDLKAPMQAAQVDQPTYKNIVNQLDAVAQDFGMVPEQHGGFQTILLRHAQNADKAGASLQDLEILRRSLANAGKAPTNPSAGELSRQMIDKLDETVNGLGSGNVVNQAGQTADETLSALQEARSTWRTGVKSGIVEKAIESAKNAASGYENGLRNEFRKLLNNKSFSGTFSPTERLAMQQVVRGSLKGNMLRTLGGFGVPLDNGKNFLGSVMGGGVGSTLGAAVAGPVGAAVGGPALIAAGTLAKQAASNITDKSALLTEALVKAGPNASRLFSEAMAASKAEGKESLLRAFMQAQIAASARTPAASPVPVQ